MRSVPTNTSGVGASAIDAALDPAQAARELETAADREQIFALLLRATRSRTGFAALLSVHAGELRGRRALGEARFDRSGIAELRLPRDAVPAFERAIASRTPHVGAIATGLGPIDAQLRALGGAVPRAAMVLPLTVANRTVALIVGHRGDEPLTTDDVAPLFGLVPASGRALARILAARSDAAVSRPPTAPPVPRAPTAPPAPPPPPPAAAEATSDLAAYRRVLDVYRQYGEQHGSWDELAEALRGIIRTGMETGEPDEDEQLELLLELGSVEADRLGRPDAAIEAWQSARTIDAGDRRVIEALERLFIAEGRWADQVALLEQRAALADDVDERVRLLLDAAELAQERLGDDDRAVETCERILGWQPTHAVAVHKLEEIYRAREQWPALAALLVEQASRHDDPRACVNALESAAEIYEQRVEDPRAAFLVWLEVLRREPDRASLVDVLEQLAPAAAAWYELLPECAALADEIEGEQPAVAARLWRQIGRWRRDLGAQEDAAAALDRALRIEGDDVEILAALVELRRAVGPWPELAGALAQLAALELDPVRRAPLYAELGELHESRLGEPAEAATFYQKALEADPDGRAALDALRRLHRAQGQWDALAAVLGRLADEARAGSAVADAVELYLELGAICADRLARPDDGVAAFEAVLALDPRSAAAFDGLKRVYQATGRREAYLETREAELDAGASDADRYAELAAGWEEIPGGLERAAAAWEKAIALDATRDSARQGLARVLRRLGRWDELASALRAHHQVTSAAAERASILLELARVLESSLHDVAGAIRACQDVLALPVDHAAALDALARLHQRAGRWKEALDALERQAAITADAVARADLQQRIAHLHAGRGDATSARAAFERALALDPHQAAAHEGIAALHRDQGDAARAVHHLLRAAQASSSRFDAIRCLTAAADLYRNQLGDVDKARDCLQRVLELDPDHADAKHGLGEMLAGAGQWEALWPHLEQRVEQVALDPDASPEERRDVYVQAARCAVELGRFPKALQLFDRAVAIEPPDSAILLARADALARSGDRDAAAKAYDALLARAGTHDDPAQRAEVYWRLAQIEKERGRIAQAFAYVQKVLEVDPRHRAALGELAALYVDRRRLDDAVATLHELASAVGVAERPAVLERIGDLHRDRMRNPERAASLYLQAVDLDATNHRVLQKLLDVQSEIGEWSGAIDTIHRFIALERDPVRRGPYHQAAAAIRQFELADLEAALASYEAALDAYFAPADPAAPRPPLDPALRARALEAFQSIDEILTVQKDWQREERAYRQMLERMPKDDPLAVVLWHGLGEIYRTRLKRYDRAIHSFETAHALDPAKSPARVQILAELYALGKSESPSERASRLLEADPSNPEAFRVLGRACVEEGRIDEAWCVCRALVFLKQANPAEDELYRRYQGQERRKAKEFLDEDTWGLVRTADEDRVISSIFSLVWEAPVALRAGPPKRFDLEEAEKLKVEGGSGAMAKIFTGAARILNVPLPHVYVQPERSGRLLLANCLDGRRLYPAVIVGRDLMTGYRDTELAFAVAGTLALLRSTYYLRLALSTVDELEAALAAAAAIAGKTILIRSQPGPQIQSYAAEMQKRLAPETLHAVRQLVERLPERPDLARWRAAVDTAARRAALLVCGELAAAARMLSGEAALPGGLRPADKVRELVLYSVSPGYFAARRHLGVTVT